MSWVQLTQTIGESIATWNEESLTARHCRRVSSSCQAMFPMPFRMCQTFLWWCAIALYDIHSFRSPDMSSQYPHRIYLLHFHDSNNIHIYLAHATRSCGGRFYPSDIANDASYYSELFRLAFCSARRYRNVYVTENVLTSVRGIDEK
jgi:hypothetical protein